MTAMIDLGDELLIDISLIADPYIRLAVISFGQPVVQGSQWVAVNKQLAVIGGFSSVSNAGGPTHLLRKGLHANFFKSSKVVA